MKQPHGAARLVPAVLGLGAVLGGCRAPEPPLPEQPPEPQALREAIQAPLERARAAGDALRRADAQRRDAADAAAR